MAAYGVVRGMMVNGVDEAMGYIASLPKTEDGARSQRYYMSTVASEMLEQGIDAAKSWVDSISDPDLKGGALSRVAESAIRDDLSSIYIYESLFRRTLGTCPRFILLKISSSTSCKFLALGPSLTSLRYSVKSSLSERPE